MRIRVWFSDADAATRAHRRRRRVTSSSSTRYCSELGRAALYRCRGSVCSPTWPVAGRDVTALLVCERSPIHARCCRRSASDRRSAAHAARLRRLAVYSDVGVGPGEGIRSLARPLRVRHQPSGSSRTYLVRIRPSTPRREELLVGKADEPRRRADRMSFACRRHGTTRERRSRPVGSNARRRIEGRRAQPQSRGFSRGHAVCRYAIRLRRRTAARPSSGSISITFARRRQSATFAKRSRGRPPPGLDLVLTRRT